MDDEFALCWNNFQENIASGFQNLFDRGDLVDVTLACDGKLLQAHKIVLAICSPYFQEMFITNPCRHPIIVLKDVSYTVMTELLQFMYQGVVNVKHTELNSFMKIAQQLQIKGLATSSTSTSQPAHQNQSHHHTQKSPNSPVGSFGSKSALDNYSNAFHSSSLIGQKRSALDYSHLASDSGTSSKKHLKRSSDSVDNDISAESMENLSSEDSFPIPQISMIESGRFDLSNVKRETDSISSPGSTRNLPAPFNFDYSRLANTSGAGSSSSTINANHMEIPTGGNVTMLSSTSLLHGNCIFNRNNTVATQQGMKTYWLCKSYRITMCRARCITHQGRVISATGMHNHQPHMKGAYPNSDFIQSGNGTSLSSNGNSISVSMRLPSVIPASISSTSSTQSQSPTSPISSANAQLNVTNAAHHESQHHLTDAQSQEAGSHVPTNIQHSPSTSQHHHHHHHQSHHTEHVTHSVDTSPQHNTAVSLQNMMQNVLSQNSLMHLTNIAPMLNPMQSHSHLIHHQNDLHVPSNDGVESAPNMHSPGSPRNTMQHAHHLARHHVAADLNGMAQHHLQVHAHHQQQTAQSNTENSSPSVVLSPPINTPSQQGQSDNESVTHHSLANELPTSASFKLEQM